MGTRGRTNPIGDQEPDCKTKDGPHRARANEAWKRAEGNEEMAASQSIRTWLNTQGREANHIETCLSKDENAKAKVKQTLTPCKAPEGPRR